MIIYIIKVYNIIFMEITSDTKKKHKYFTRSKKKIKDEPVEQIAKKSDMKNFNKNIIMVINKKIKAIFKKDDSDDYIPSALKMKREVMH